MDRVLPVRQQDALLDDEAAELVAPDRQAGFQAELGQVVGAVQLELAADALLAADLDDVVPSGRRICSDRWLSIIVRPSGAGRAAIEQAVIAAREHARDRAGGVAAQAVGDEPLAVEQRLGRGSPAPRGQCIVQTSRPAWRASHGRIRCIGRPAPRRRSPGNAPAVLRSVSSGGVPQPP